MDGARQAAADLHLTGGEAARSPRAAGVRRLMLTHLPAWNDPDVLAEARAVFDGPSSSPGRARRSTA